jgi:ABC-type nickel/cobalt efflux system permease component RcnA
MLALLATAGQRGFGLGLVVSAFLFGFRHGIDWDHIAAISDITSSQEDRRQSILFGTLYALGHALVVFAIGSVAIVLGENLPEGVDEVTTRIVGVTLIILGVYVFVALIRHGREFRMRSRWMLIFSAVRSAYRRLRPAIPPEPEPVHVHIDGDESVAVEVAEDIPVSEWHHGHHGRPGHHHHAHPEPDAFMNYGRGTAFVVGMVHGIGAETPTQLLIFITIAGAGGAVAGEILLGTFLLGLLSSNTLITLGSALGYMRASKNWTLYVTVAVLTATFSLVIGTIFVLGKTTLLPALFGG